MTRGTIPKAGRLVSAPVPVKGGRGLVISGPAGEVKALIDITTQTHPHTEILRYLEVGSDAYATLITERDTPCTKPT